MEISGKAPAHCRAGAFGLLCLLQGRGGLPPRAHAQKLSSGTMLRRTCKKGQVQKGQRHCEACKPPNGGEHNHAESCEGDGCQTSHGNPNIFRFVHFNPDVKRWWFPSLPTSEDEPLSLVDVEKQSSRQNDFLYNYFYVNNCL